MLWGDRRVTTTRSNFVASVSTIKIIIFFFFFRDFVERLKNKWGFKLLFFSFYRFSL